MSKHDTACLCTDCRLSALEKQVFLQDRQPQPRTPRLVEAVDMVDACDQIISDTDLALRSMSVVDIFTILHGIDARANRMRLALAAEKGRQDEIGRLITHLKSEGHDGKLNSQKRECPICQIINTLDAYEKGETQ